MSFPKVKNEPNDGRTDQPSREGPVVHVRGDSETELNLLFSVLRDDSKQPGQTYRDKNLPRSFFNPPEPKPGGSHSREGSLDFGQGNQQLQATPGGLSVFHVRSHSSPAKLPVSLSLPNAVQHLKQGSGDLIVDSLSSKYFPNNASNAWQTEQCKSQCHDVTGAAAGQNKQTHNGMVSQAVAAGLLQQPAGDCSQAGGMVGPLPQGWEQGVTPEGDIYFINHNDKSTSWYDPRIPRHLQKPGALKVGSPGQQAPTHQAHRQPAPQHGTLSQQNSQLQQSNPMAKQQVQPVVQQSGHLAKQQFLQQQQQQNQLLMKQQQQQLPTASSQIRTSSSMMSPIGQAQQQQPPPQQQPMRTVFVPDHIRLELQKLQKERERLMHEQEENARKEQMLLKELISHQATMLQTTGGQGDGLTNLLPSGLMVTPAMQQQMNISGVDPFLGQTVVGPDVHARQNSGDSGLGSCYSLPRTPEDFLGNVDALDRHDMNNMQKKQPQQQQHLAQQQQQQLCDFGMNPRQGSLGGLDMTPLSDPSIEPMAMDSDELVSTLTDDLELGRDFLDMQMMDILL